MQARNQQTLGEKTKTFQNFLFLNSSKILNPQEKKPAHDDVRLTGTKPLSGIPECASGWHQRRKAASLVAIDDTSKGSSRGFQPLQLLLHKLVSMQSVKLKIGRQKQRFCFFKWTKLWWPWRDYPMLKADI